MVPIITYEGEASLHTRTFLVIRRIAPARLTFSHSLERTGCGRLLLIVLFSNRNAKSGQKEKNEKDCGSKN
jgi:hypothetical protein